ncbi:MAG: ArsR family transcriptional regulator [Methanomicrobiales archaeon]|nr:ArsR family transcriptional regulator [Methanomicrobiales archaeon]
MSGHVRIVNDPIELVPLIVTFNNPRFKEIYALLNKHWMTEEELCQHVEPQYVSECLSILRKGNLIEEQWRMPDPGRNPVKEFRTTYSKFRASFQCSMTDLGDLLYASVSNDEKLRSLADQIVNEIKAGNTSINDISRKFGCSTVTIKGLAKRVTGLDTKGQGLVLVEREG